MFKLLCVALACYLTHNVRCGVIPELSVKKNDPPKGNETFAEMKDLEVNLDNSYDQKRLNCMWLAYQAMLSGDEQYLTEECVTLFLTPSNRDSKNIKAAAESDDLRSLENELNDVSSQWQESQSQNGASKRGDDDEKKSDTSQEEEDSDLLVKDSSLDDDSLEPLTSNGIDAPFVTSVKEINEDFLVIPIKYLKSQIKSDENALLDDEIDQDQNSKRSEMSDDSLLDITDSPENVEKGNSKSDASDVMASSESFSGKDVSNLEKALLTLQNEENNSNEENLDFDVLHQVQNDINRLEEDLKIIEEKTA